MKNIRYFTQKYVEWVIRLGRVKFSLLGVIVLAIWALCTQMLLNWLFIGEINWFDLGRSIVFGLLSAPIVIYFFTVLVEKLEYSRQDLARLVVNLRNEVTERISTEEKLSVALDNIEQTSRDKTRLMATISHELRTPLNGIIGLSRILLDEKLSDKQRNYLQTIQVSAVSLGHIFNDIIDLEKIDSRRIELVMKPTSLSALLNDIGNFARLMTAQKHLQFKFISESHLPDWILMDYARLNQILWNLISNAVKFTQQGNVCLQVSTSENGSQLCFQVSDTGVGIPLAEQKHIFEMYYQVQSPEHKLYGGASGSGIGLAVAKDITQLMGGELAVRSELGQGTTFTLTIPLEEATEQRENDLTLPKQLHILLVEDIELNVVVAKSVLEKLGYVVDVAMTGQEAIRKFEQQFYDLLLLDIQLPDISGFEVAQTLRKNYEIGIYDALPPLIALTANVISDKTEYQRQGMDDVLRKPLAVDDLNSTLAEYFDEGTRVTIPQIHTSSLFNELDSRFDRKMLTELVDILGMDALMHNLHIFQQSMPDYVANLQYAYNRYVENVNNIMELTTAAHKIKGAFAAVGLLRLQEIANFAQNEQTPNWSEKIGSWVMEIIQHWQKESEELKVKLKGCVG